MKQFIKKVLNVKDCVIEDVRLSPRYNEPFVIQIVLHPVGYHEVDLRLSE